MAIFKLFTTALATLLLYGLWKVLRAFIHAQYSALRNVPGPPNPSLIYGNLREVSAATNSSMHEQWMEKHGHTIRYKAQFGTDRLCTADLRALSYILQHSQDYQKPAPMRLGLSRIFGEGLLIAEGSKHTQQRRIMNPSFSQAQIRELTEVFIDKANQLRDIWLEITSDKTEPVRLNVLSWLSKTTLDVIGIAGFGYQFGALNLEDQSNELNDAFNVIFSTTMQRPPIFALLQGSFPTLFEWIPSERERKTKAARATMRRIGMDLVQEKKRAIVAAAGGDKHVVVEKGDIHGRDLLSLLIKANMATDLPESQRLSDEDVLAQVPTFLTAGHETSSTGAMWALFAISQDASVQSKLREELLAVPTENPSMDELMALPYLDAVLRETMRVHTPVPNTLRVATKDDVIPLSQPFVDRNGETQTSIRIGKGDTVFIPILLVNRSKAIWGEDAHEFKPERWFNAPEIVQQIPNVWGNTLSFISGPRGCIGYRFAVVEMKALLFTLVRSFEFELAVPADQVEKKASIVQRPYIKTEMEKGNQMPLLVKPYRRL